MESDRVNVSVNESEIVNVIRAAAYLDEYDSDWSQFEQLDPPEVIALAMLQVGHAPRRHSSSLAAAT